MGDNDRILLFKTPKNEIDELKVWQEVAIESFTAIDAYLRKMCPNLPEHYGMPQDGVRIAFENTSADNEELESQAKCITAQQEVINELEVENRKLIENSQLASGALKSIKELLDSGGIPQGTFPDDQVRNLVAMYNNLKEENQKLREALSCAYDVISIVHGTASGRLKIAILKAEKALGEIK